LLIYYFLYEYSMNDNNLKFTENQIRALISSIYYVAKKNTGKITINSMEDASELIAYSCGFDSWKSLRQQLRKENSLFLNYKKVFEYPNDISLQELQKKYDNENNLQFSFNTLSLNEKKIKLPKYPYSSLISIKEIVESSNVPLMIGSFYDKSIKYEQNYQINPQNTLIIEQDNYFISSIIEQTRNKGKSSLILSSKKPPDDLQDTHVIKLDPLNEIYCSEHFDILFGLNYEDAQSFDVFWSLIIKDFIHQNDFAITTKFLKYSLEIEFLCFYLLHLQKNKHPLASLLARYLNSLKVVIKDQSFIFTKEGAQQHLKNIEEIYLKNAYLEKLYQQGIFSTSLESHLFNHIKNNHNVYVQLPQQIPDFLTHVYDTTLDYTFEQYDQYCGNLNFKKSNYQRLIISDNSKVLQYNSLLNKNYTFIIQKNNTFPNNMEQYSQILFSHYPLTYSPPPSWLLSFYSKTEQFSNIFAFQNKELQNISTTEGFLWQLREKSPDYSSDVFDLHYLKVFQPL